MSGWYKRQRNITERPWFKDAKVLQLYDYLEATAYVADGKYADQIIRRGSLPTTRPEMMEATGLSYKEVDLCLRKLISYGDIIVKGNCRFSIVTICGYDSLQISLPLFGTADGTADGTAEDTTTGTTEGTAHLSTIEERIYKKDNLISPYSPYKKERETRDAVLEIKKRYNKIFDGKLPPLYRLHVPTRRMVEACIERFGLQSVDRVFNQVLAEPFSLGQNKTGFVASFQYIFEPKNFQQYLERAILRQRKTVYSARTNSDSWEQCAEELRKAVGKEVASLSIDTIRFLSFDEKKETLLLGVPTADTYDYIENNLVDVMNQILPRYYGTHFMVKYKIIKQ